jgi:MFS family permease
MQSKEALKQTRIGWGEFLPAFFIVVNSFTWYSLIYAVFAEIVNSLQITHIEILMLFCIHYTGIAVSAILGSMVFIRTRRSSLLMWILMGTFASLLLSAIERSTYAITFVISLFLGISIGIGLPSCLAYFADSTVVENRGLLGGITWGVSGLGMFLLAFILSVLGSSAAILILAIWRGFGLVILLFLMNKEKVQQEVPSYLSVLHSRTVILYLVPWVMFCLVNWIEAPLLENLFGDFYNFVIFIEFAISGIFALIGGVFADLIGRKRVIITGFIVLGLEYAVLGLLSGIQISWYLYVVFDGITWGMFSAVFFMVLWGDLAGSMKKEKYYVVGGLPYLLAGLLSILVKPYVEFIPLNTAFSLASFFLFLAVLPLMFAPETLPEKKIKERELKKYVEKAKKIKEKYG